MGHLPGPHLVPVTDVSGWWSKKCDEARLARMLRDTGEPVVVLNGRVELGPRALGNRSILAAATSSKMKNLLNDMKGRESYGWWLRFSWKAVCAQIRTCCSTTPCAPTGWRGSRQLFTSTAPPGSRQSTRDRTLSWNGVLVEYEKLSKIPVLCNTSANHKGRGFFSDVRSVAQWRRVDAIWCDRRLYTREL